MAQDGSVAPKERINIKFKPATGGLNEDVELPLKLLVVGDFTGRPDDRTIEERQLVNIDKDNFNDVMKGMGLSTTISVPNKLDDGPDAGTLGIELKFSSMRAFEPEEIARQVPELKKLLDLRAALASLKGPLSNMPSFRKTLQGVLDDAAAREKLLSELTDKP